MVTVYRRYIKYYYDNPNVLSHSFFTILDWPPVELREKVFPHKIQMLGYNMVDSLLDDKDSKLVSEMITEVINGKLMFYMSGKSTYDSMSLLESIEPMIKRVLKR